MRIATACEKKIKIRVFCTKFQCLRLATKNNFLSTQQNTKTKKKKTLKTKQKCMQCCIATNAKLTCKCKNKI